MDHQGDERIGRIVPRNWSCRHISVPYDCCSLVNPIAHARFRHWYWLIYQTSFSAFFFPLKTYSAILLYTMLTVGVLLVLQQDSHHTISGVLQTSKDMLHVSTFPPETQDGPVFTERHSLQIRFHSWQASERTRAYKRFHWKGDQVTCQYGGVELTYTHRIVWQIFETTHKQKNSIVRSDLFPILPFSLKRAECGASLPLRCSRWGFKLVVHLYPTNSSTLEGRMQVKTSSTLKCKRVQGGCLLVSHPILYCRG